MQHGQLWIGTGLMPANKKEHGPDDINWTAGFGGALAISPSDASPEEAPRKGDLETARLLGARVAEWTKKSADKQDKNLLYSSLRGAKQRGNPADQPERNQPMGWIALQAAHSSPLAPRNDRG